MCITAWIWQTHLRYPLILLSNRDEFHERPTRPVEWWGDGDQKVLGGRDAVAGGTWLGCTRSGRLAFLTNFREPNSSPFAKSRGDLTLRFLQPIQSTWRTSNSNQIEIVRIHHQVTIFYMDKIRFTTILMLCCFVGHMGPLEFADEVAKEATEYNGFNLVLADLCSKIMAYVSNRPLGKPALVQVVSPGLHVLSNANLDTPWPKAQRLHKNFEELLRSYGDHEILGKEMVLKLMSDSVKAYPDRLPNTGCPPEWEFNLSSIFVEIESKKGWYGTRSMAALSVTANGEVSFFERYLDTSDGIWKEHTVEYQMGNMQEKKQQNIYQK